MKILDGKKSVIITGGAKGIGRASAELLARNGYKVLINYRHSEQAAVEIYKRLTEAGLDVRIFQADVANRAQVDAMIDYCLKAFGGVDILINNAGISYSTFFDRIREAEWDEVMDVNLKGVFHCCQAVTPVFLRQKKGCIVNISSVWGLVGAACEAHYSAAKAGVIGLTKALAKELGPSNIRVNCIAPGVIATDMISGLSLKEVEELRAQIPLKRIGSAEEIAETVYFLASERAGYINGQVISPNGGFVI